MIVMLKKKIDDDARERVSEWIKIYSRKRKEKKAIINQRTVFLTVLAGAGADFLKSALTVTAIVVCLCVFVVDEKRVRYMRII